MNRKIVRALNHSDVDALRNACRGEYLIGATRLIAELDRFSDLDNLLLKPCKRHRDPPVGKLAGWVLSQFGIDDRSEYIT